jgi:hypothetical protein
VRLTISHRFPFSRRLPAGLDSPEAWDALRQGADTFGLPASRSEWEAAAERSGLDRRAVAIARIADEIGAVTVCSYGVGTGMLEWNLHRVAPHLALGCTEFAPRTVDRLGAHFDGVPVVLHELRADPPREADLHLLHRVDTELSDEEWPAVFARFREPVLVAASELVDLRSIAREAATRVLHPRAQAAGWIRTEAALRSLWAGSHTDRKVDLAGLPGYLLTRRIP